MMSMLAMTLTATAVGLLALAWLLLRRADAAVLEAERPGDCSPSSCAGPELLLATATDEGGAGAPATPGTTQAGALVAAPKRAQRKGPSRRAFLRNTWLIAWGGVIGGFSLASLGFLWPNLRGGFGATIEIGSEEDILAEIRQTRRPIEFSPGRTYLVEYDPRLDPDGQYAELTNGARVMALYWRCVHLGCKVPWCLTSQWFECPCHGSRYNRWGEWRGGPAPRGLDRFVVRIEEGNVLVDTSAVLTGPSRQSPALDQPPEGPSCL